MLNDKHRLALKESGLTDATIDKARVFSVENAEEYRRLAHLSPTADARVPALAFEYPDCAGYVRLRPDSPMMANPEYREQPEHSYAPALEPKFIEAPKYLSPVGSTTRLYVRRDLCPDILNGDVKLWLVEGEKKALAAIQSGLAAIAAPGVSCFGDSIERSYAKGVGKDVRRLHPDLNGVPLRNREVVISFDSDIDEKEQVLRAAAALGQMLDDAGADVRIAYLPGAEDGGKQGLDDLLASLSPEERMGPHPLRRVEDSVRPFNVVECLEEFLRESWDSLDREEQDTELGRLVRLACHLLPKKHDLDKFLKQCSRVLEVLAERVAGFVVPVKKEAPNDPRAWVNSWMVRNGVTYECRNSSDRFQLGGRSTESEVLLRRMRLDAATYGGPGRELVDDALFFWTHQRRDAALDVLRDRLKYRPELDDSHVRAFVRALTGKEDPVDVAVLKHFVWQVKRKLNDQEVERHLMVILHGAQGAGKSIAVRKLLGPVDQFKDEPGDVTILADERQVFRLARSFVVFFDEMAKASKTDMDAFKNRISQVDVSWRALGSNTRSTGRNRATFIGASNNSLPDLVVDPTGVRRFYQVDCLDHIDWDAINAIDYTALWASVDEKGPPPVAAVMEQLTERQEELRVKDAVEEFVAARCVQGEEWTPAHQVFEVFKEFLKAENYPASFWSSAKFGRRFSALMGDDRKKASNGTKYQVTVVPSSALLDKVDEFRRRTASNSPMADDKKSA